MDRLQYSGAEMAAGESSQRHPYIHEACAGGKGDDSGMGIIFINCNWVVSRWQWLFYM